MRSVEVIDIGLTPYSDAHAMQVRWMENKRHDAGLMDRLFFVEHPEVYTFGRKSKEGIPAHLSNAIAVERGGEATYHNPGQLVAYPVLTLSEGERDIHKYLRKLESVLIDVLASFGVSAIRREGATGVWVGDGERKIASVGVAVSSWVTYHGIALNVSNDLNGFSKIHPCGFSADIMTSMKRELREHRVPKMEAVKEAFLKSFCAHFEREIGYSNGHRQKAG